MTEAATPHPPSPEIFKGPSENGLKFSLVTRWGVGQQDIYDIPKKAPWDAMYSFASPFSIID